MWRGRGHPDGVADLHDLDVPASRHRVAADEQFEIAAHDTAATSPFDDEQQAVEALEELRERIGGLQARFLAEESRALLIVLQGFDGAGKDTVITHVLSAFDPSGCRVYNFKKAAGEEAAHDFLWRFHQQTPARGMVHVFDRSYYEEVIAARVHDEISEELCAARYESINDFERMLVREGTVILKFFLHISKDAQAERVEERLERREKQADFSAADVKEREHWDDYDRAYEDAVNATSTEWAPWFAIPADHKWHVRAAVATVVADTLEALEPEFPELDEEELEEAGLES
jgi:PPK2 family polyphosphate:nucleotide phosphotransferase